MRWLGLACVMLIIAGRVLAQDLPVDCDPNAPYTNGPPSLSPDGAFVVFFDCFDFDAETYAVYSYDLAADEVIQLGESIPGTERIWVARWLDARQVVLRSETGGGTYNDRSVYLANPAVTGSVQEIARQHVFRPLFGASPPRYEWVTEDGDTYTAYWYDLQTRERWTLYEMPCEPIDVFKCETATMQSNNTFTETHAPTAFVFSIGDPALEKRLEIRAYPSGKLLHTARTLDSGSATWLAEDTLAILNQSFDLEDRVYVGRFIQVDLQTGGVIATAPFEVNVGETLERVPDWLERNGRH